MDMCIVPHSCLKISQVVNLDYSIKTKNKLNVFKPYLNRKLFAKPTEIVLMTNIVLLLKIKQGTAFILL